LAFQFLWLGGVAFEADAGDIIRPFGASSPYRGRHGAASGPRVDLIRALRAHLPRTGEGLGQG